MVLKLVPGGGGGGILAFIKDSEKPGTRGQIVLIREVPA